MILQPIPLEWSVSSVPNLERALRCALRKWEGTPYEDGQRFCQRGADCIGGVSGVLDEMDGRQRATCPSLPSDAALHNPALAAESVEALLKLYAPIKDVTALGLACPGDIVVTRHPGGGPGHVMIVGPDCNTIWHGLPGVGFHQGGWSFDDQQFLSGVYRILDSHRWR